MAARKRCSANVASMSGSIGHCADCARTIARSTSFHVPPDVIAASEDRTTRLMTAQSGEAGLSDQTSRPTTAAAPRAARTRMALSTILAIILATPILAHAQCRPIVVIGGMEGGGQLPQAKKGWYILREQALGIPVPETPPECSKLLQGEPETPLAPYTVQLCTELLGGAGVAWNQLPGVNVEYIDPDWVDARGLTDKALGRQNWQPDCPWTKAKDWIVGTICDHGNPHYETCKRFPGACAVRIPTATWAKRERTNSDGYRYYACTGYAEVWALDEPASRAQ